MYAVPIGEYIRQQRQDKGLTQEQLCEGICDTVTLSRIENSRQTPSQKRLAALLGRLGLPTDRIMMLLTQRELELEALEKEIIDCNVRRDTAAGLKLLRELDEHAEEDDLLTQQLILRSKVILGKEDGPYSPEEQLELLLHAIHLTVPRFQADHIDRFLYTLNEIKVINQIAITYSKLEKHEQALDIYRQLLAYIQSHFQDIQQSAGHLPLVAFNYALELAICKRHGEAIAIAEVGRKASVKYGHYQFLPGCIHILAECSHHQGNDEESRALYAQAYYLYLALDDSKNTSRILEEVKQYFGPSFRF